MGNEEALRDLEPLCDTLKLTFQGDDPSCSVEGGM